MQYQTANKSHCAEICKLSARELGWSASENHLEEILDNYPASIAVDNREIRGFIYAQALSSDILRIYNFVVESGSRNQGVGSELLRIFEEQARNYGYEAILFPENPIWFSEHSLRWLDRRGYRNIYTTTRSNIVVKEIKHQAKIAV